MSRHRDELLIAFENEEADLAAFTRGELPTRHAARVRSATRSDAAFMTGLAVVLAGVLWSLLGYLVFVDGRLFAHAGDGSADVVGLVALVLVTGVLPAAGVAWAIWTWVVHARTPARADVVEGAVTLVEHRQRGMVVLRELRVAGRSFAVNELAFRLLREGDRYRVFYVPVGDVVVGIAPLDASP